MNDEQRREMQRLTRVREFASFHGKAFKPESDTAKRLTALETLHQEISAMATQQVVGISQRGAGTEEKSTLLESLRAQMEGITDTAKAIAEDEPGWAEKFRMPRSPSHQSLLNAARAFHTEAAKSTELFLAYEMEADFLTVFDQTIREIQEAEQAQAAGGGARTGATAALDAKLEQASTKIRQIGAAIQNKFRNDPATLAAWSTASRVERPPRRPDNNVPTDPPSP